MQTAMRNMLSPVHVHTAADVLPAGHVACLLPLARNRDHSKPQMTLAGIDGRMVQDHCPAAPLGEG